MLVLAVVAAWVAIILLGFAVAALQRQLASSGPTAFLGPSILPKPAIQTLDLPGVIAVIQDGCNACASALDVFDALPEGLRRGLTVVSGAGYIDREGVTLDPVLVAAIAAPAYPWLVSVDREGTIIAAEPYRSKRRARDLLTQVIPDSHSQEQENHQ